ncbi:ABC transporter ATP-binding protein [Cohnella sp. REN36]|uniref:ABC transporter ATP-binding protein n=1 Tax=Cohnella sp. REN36 TaxID=2887347 RepID=UPI001D13498E|nr:ABC transporter ATP-binding protein [Cohnella sp. REN36]MCC3377116.1 ABC transporter ATP-binding protein [Cohnella sp. REN36]
MSEQAIELRQVSKRQGAFRMEDVTLDIRQGYITGLIGPNGAGKSTLIRQILGMSLPHAGTVRVLGMPMPEREDEIRRRIGFVADESPFYEHLSIRGMARIVAPFYADWDESAFRAYLDRFELEAGAKIRSLSKGMRMKLSLAMAFSHQPDLLIMDEPTAGLDPVFRRELLDLLADYVQDERRTVVFSTHITTDLERIADYIAFLHRGRLQFCEAKDDVLDRYALVKAGPDLLDRDVRRSFVGIRETAVGFEALSADREAAVRLFAGYASIERPTLEDIMYFTAKGEPSVHA